MPLLTETERRIIQDELRLPYLTASQRGSLQRELQADEESVAPGSLDARLLNPRKK